MVLSWLYLSRSLYCEGSIARPVYWLYDWLPNAPCFSWVVNWANVWLRWPCKIRVNRLLPPSFQANYPLLFSRLLVFSTIRVFSEYSWYCRVDQILLLWRFRKLNNFCVEFLLFVHDRRPLNHELYPHWHSWNDWFTTTTVVAIYTVTTATSHVQEKSYSVTKFAYHCLFLIQWHFSPARTKVVDGSI